MSTVSATALSPDSARQGYDRSGPVRVAVLGVGMMGQDHARRLATLTAGADLVAVSDVDAARTDAVAAEFGVRAIHDPKAAVLDPDVDALVIATPGFTHEDLVLLALEAGKPVLCEKPLTTTPQTSRRIVEAEAALGRQLVQVGFMRRFDAGYQQLRALIASGEFGAPLFLHCAHRNASTPPNFSSEMLMLDSVVHEVDAVRFLTGEEVVAIRVLAPRSTTSAPEGLLDPQFVIMETESGVLVDVEIFVNTTFGYEVRTELVAERGQARIGLPEGVAGGMVTQSGRGWGGTVPKDFKERFGVAYDVEFQRWIDAVRAGTNVDGPGVWDGYAAAAVCAAGVESLRTGERVVVDLGPRP